MRIESLLALPARPPSEVEWEDLLFRLELMPRALGVALEDLEPIPPDVRLVLDAMAEREASIAHQLERATGLGEPELPEAQSRLSQEDGLERFVRVRRRNFALVQRRGIDVWGWESPFEGGRTATVYQMLTFLAHRDVEALGSIRSRARSGSPEC